MSDTPNDPLDDRIRDAITEVVGGAPPPIPFDRLAAPTDRSVPTERRRWWTAAAAAAIVVTGVAAISLVASTRSDRPTSDSTPTASSTSPASTPATSTPGTSRSTTTASTRPPLGDPSGFSTGPFPDIPDGSIDAGRGDVIGVTADGIISLYPDVLAAEPGEPLVLTDGVPRPGQTFVGLDAVALHGSLISNLPVDLERESWNQVTTLSQPGSDPMPLIGGSLGAVSHDGTRFLVRVREGVRNELAVYDAARGVVTRRGVAAFPSDQVGGGAFVWSEDDRELYSFTPDNGVRQAVFTRIDSATLEVIDTTVLEDWGLDRRRLAAEHAYFAGVWGGHVIFGTSDGGVRAYTMPGLIAAEVDDPAWWLSNSAPFDIAADGRTAVWITDGTTYVQRLGEAPVALRDDLVEVAFVDAVAADPAPPPASTPTTIAPEIPGLFPEPGDAGLSTFTAIAPSGSIEAAPGDMVSLSVDGDLWLHPGAFDPPQFGRTPSEPVRLVDGEDPRVSVEEGTGPNVVDWVGGFVNGALMYGDCCEPAVGNVLAVSEPDGPPALLGYGWSAAADATGRQWATASDYGLQLLDFERGRGTSRSLQQDAAETSLQNIGSVTWVGEELWLLGWSDTDGSVLARYRADATLAEIARHQLAPSGGAGSPTASHAIAGRLADGTIVLTATTGAFDADQRTTELRFLAPDGSDATVESPWPALPVNALGVRVSPDGTTLAYTIDDTAYLLRAGEDPVEWGTDTAAAVWFVTTPAMPIGTPCPEPGPDGPRLLDPPVFADLDGDGLSERLTTRSDGPLVWYGTCGTPLSLPELETVRKYGVYPVDIQGDGQTELWVGDDPNASSGVPYGAEHCVALYRLIQDELTRISELQCVGVTGGMACSVQIDGSDQMVFYTLAFGGGTDIETATSAEVTARAVDGPILGTRTYSAEELPALRPILDLAC